MLCKCSLFMFYCMFCHKKKSEKKSRPRANYIQIDVEKQVEDFLRYQTIFSNRSNYKLMETLTYLTTHLI